MNERLKILAKMVLAEHSCPQCVATGIEIGIKFSHQYMARLMFSWSEGGEENDEELTAWYCGKLLELRDVNFDKEKQAKFVLSLDEGRDTMMAQMTLDELKEGMATFLEKFRNAKDEAKAREEQS